MNKEQEENVAGFTGDIKDFLRQNDFTSALILLDDLKKYIIELKPKKQDVEPDLTESDRAYNADRLQRAFDEDML